MVENLNVEYIAGGATQNTMRVCQWMLQKPNATAFIGCVGEDDFAAQLRKSASGDNVAVHYMVDSKTPTGTCAVLIKDKERSLIANLSAANNYKIDHLKQDDITAVYKKAQYFYSAGFFLTVSPDSLMTVAEHAHDNGKTFIMNISAPFIAEFFTDPLMKAMPYADYLFGNESEAEALAKKLEVAGSSIEEYAQAFAKLDKKNSGRARTVVITQGSKATIVATPDAVTSYPVPPMNSDDIVDSNGAGDSFVAGFLSQLVQGKDIAKCVEAGSFAAQTILKVSGIVVPTDAPTFE
jgi:adenosine kinase